MEPTKQINENIIEINAGKADKETNPKSNQNDIRTTGV
jgi:hypothetical protein